MESLEELWKNRLQASETIVNCATPAGTSYRTTIPAFIVTKFGLQKGDKQYLSLDIIYGKS